MKRQQETPLTRAWDEARDGRGGLVLLAGAADPSVARGLDALVAAATRDAAEIARADAASGPVTLSLLALPAPDAGFLDFAHVASGLREAAMRAPRLVVVESVECAPPALLRLLAFLGRELRDAHVLVVATRGDAAIAEDPAQARVLADLARAGVWLSLETPLEAPAAPPALAVSMTRSGRHWTLARGDRRVVLRDTRGLQHLDRLLREPGRSFRALDLMERDDADAGPALDAQARAAYRRTLAALREDARGDPAAERDAAFLERTLARDTGLGGRTRRVDSSAERARVAVTRSIRRAIEAIGARDPELGRWLADSVQTGHACCFEPRE